MRAQGNVIAVGQLDGIDVEYEFAAHAEHATAMHAGQRAGGLAAGRNDGEALHGYVVHDEEAQGIADAGVGRGDGLIELKVDGSSVS